MKDCVVHWKDFRAQYFLPKLGVAVCPKLGVAFCPKMGAEFCPKMGLMFFAENGACILFKLSKWLCYFDQKRVVTFAKIFSTRKC